MVLNSRMRITGGRDTYTSSTDMSIPTSILRDTSSQSTQLEDTQRTEGEVSTVAIPKEIFNNDCEMGQTNVSRRDSCALLELTPSQGQSTRKQHGPHRITVTVRSLGRHHVQKTRPGNLLSCPNKLQSPILRTYYGCGYAYRVT